MTPPVQGDAGELRRGTLYAFAAYGIWGLFPLYFHALKPSGAFEILAHRIVWSLVFCGLILVGRRDLGWLWPVLRNRRLMLGMLAAAALIASNWGFYVYAVITGQTTEASLGYFLNPIVTVALGVVGLAVGLAGRRRVEAGEFVAIMGPSGCGKSTLLNIIGTIDRPTYGRYLFEGADIARAPEAALARRAPDDARVAERFELYACGVELANGFGELTDAPEQRRRFMAEMDEKHRVHGERYPLDEDFLSALAHVPPASGIALGFDRLVMLATGAPRIEDVMWTPVP